MTQEPLTIDEMRIFNLRKELAKYIWASRSGKINVAEALENTRDLVALFPDHMIDIANLLQHKIMNQITKKYGKNDLKSKGMDVSDIHVAAVNTRHYLPAVKLPFYMIG